MAFATGTPLGHVVFNPTPPRFIGVLQHAAVHPPMIPSGDLGGHLPASFTVPGTHIPTGDMGGHQPTRGGIAFFGPGGSGIIPMPSDGGIWEGQAPPGTPVGPMPVPGGVGLPHPTPIPPGQQINPATGIPWGFLQPANPAATGLPGGAQRGQNSDQVHAQNVAGHLAAALAAARDPELRSSLAQALAAIHKHIAGTAKEHQQMLAGKVSPRLMQQAYSNGPAHSGGAQ